MKDKVVEAFLKSANSQNYVYPKALANFLFREIIEDAHYNYNISQEDIKAMTNDTVLSALRNINTSVSQRVLATYQLFQANPGRDYSFSEMAIALQVAKETSRRTCYILTTLRLIQLKQSITEKSNRQIICFYYSNSLAA